MTLKRYFASFALLLLSVRGLCCGPYYYTPQEYYMYRAYDRTDERVTHPEYYRNCIAWQRITSSDIPVEDIREVVYKYSLERTMSIMDDRKDRNSFARWIRTNRDREILDFLVLAKSCEKARFTKVSRWYYPAKHDETLMTLEDVRDRSLAYDGERLRDRYALQAARAMHSLGEFTNLVSWWEKNGPSVREGIIRDLTEGYVAGALFLLGENEKALSLLARMSDAESIRKSLDLEGRGASDLDVLEFLSIYCPDNPEAPRLLQGVFHRMEDKVPEDYSQWYSATPEERAAMPRLSEDEEARYMDICLRAASSDLCREPAVWYYTAAYVQDIQAKPLEAVRYISLAEKVSGSPFIKESVKVMRIYLDAKTSRYDSSYRSRLLDDLRWMDSMICSRITGKVREETAEMWRVNGNYSYYYWGDMMRRIVLGEVCPRMLKCGMGRTALALANMADNRILGLVDSYTTNWYGGKYHPEPMTLTMEQYRLSTTRSNWHDYSDAFFCMMDDVDLGVLVQYVSTIGRATSPLDRFLDGRSHVDMDYFNELIGTRYLRKTDYAGAVQYLSMVSAGYQFRTNLTPYMDRLPFEFGHERGALLNPDYKLSFAKRMLDYQRQAASMDPDRAGYARVMMGLGMRSSFDFCWALTQYHLSCDDQWPYDDNTVSHLAEAEDLMKSGLGMIRDEELAAQCCVKLMQWKRAVKEHPDTEAALRTRSGCDRLIDYNLGLPSCWIGHKQ